MLAPTKEKRVKGTHAIYFSSSFYIINQKPVIPRTDFHSVTTCLLARWRFYSI